MSLPYKIYTTQTGVGPFSFSGIVFITGKPAADQLKVYKNDVKLIRGVGIADGDYTVQETGQTITMRVALISSDTIEIRRETDDLERSVIFSDGAKLSASTLNKSLDQLFFLIQEKSFYSTSIEEFPSSLIDIDGITGRNVIIWEAAQQQFVPGQPDMSINELNDVNTSFIQATGQVLAWSGTSWTPTSNVSFNSASDITFTGTCTFSNAVTVPSGSGNTHAVNRGQLDAIIASHSDSYTQGLQNRVTALEESKMEIIGKGRYWNTAGNYYPKVKANTGTTFPVFDTSAGQADYENLYNVSLRTANYVPLTCTSAGGNDKYTSSVVLLPSWVKWDVFTWDFVFEDTLIIDDDSRSNVGSNQYHVILSMDGKGDSFSSGVGVNRGGSLKYTQNINESLNFGPAAPLTSFQPTHMDAEFNWPFYTNLHAYSGGTRTGQETQTITHPLSGGGSETFHFPFESLGESRYFSSHNDHLNWKDQTSFVWQDAYDRKSSMGVVTEPMALGPMVCNKEQTGFSVMYALNRPVVWSATQTSSPVFMTPHFFMYEHASDQGDNDPTDLKYSGHPLLKDFNFRFTIIQ